MTDTIPTPAASPRRPTVAVLGAGIAGLTAAQELVERGFEVTVYEPRADERAALEPARAQDFPPVKLGGLAASQFSSARPGPDGRANLRPFPGRRGQPRIPGNPLAGEHGFRFFPAYYLHTWDLFQRIPLYEAAGGGHGTARWRPTARTMMDNVRRVVTQGTTVAGKPSFVFPRESPHTPAELLATLGQLNTLGFSVGDVTTFIGRLLRYLVTSPLRRARELQNISAYDYFTGRDNATGIRRFTYSPAFDAYLLEMPRVLAAFDSRWGDARTNVTTYLQLQFQMDRRDNKADGVLNGPTTESWFDHWYRHLDALGVRFVRAAAHRLDVAASGPDQPPHLRPRAVVTFADGSRSMPDYTVVAVDAPAAEALTDGLRTAGTGGAVAGLDGFTTSAPPAEAPLQPAASRTTGRRDPYAMDEMGRLPWDRFQTLGGIQYFFDTEFQILRGHVYYSGTEWALSSINQQGMWEQRPSLHADGYVSVLSVDIGDFNTPSTHLRDAAGKPKAARDCTADEIATEVWRQIATALTSAADGPPEAFLPWPSWYALDRGLVLRDGRGPVVRNDTPYLVPIVGDWPNRPGADPWNPHNSSVRTVIRDERWRHELEHRNVWQARHGGYQVHNNSVVFAGTWTKTFTRMTSMEAAGESARHAVNAILDHFIWVESNGTDLRENVSLEWRFPYGFIDQGLSSPIRMPSPAGDYCYVFDIENREPADSRLLRSLDSCYCDHALPHPLDGIAAFEFPAPPPEGDPPMTQPFQPQDQSQQFFRLLQAWQQFLQQWLPVTALAAPPPVPPGPAAAPGADYAQQLFGYLQTWRQHLEQLTAGAAGPTPPPAAPGGPGGWTAPAPAPAPPASPTAGTGPGATPPQQAPPVHPDGSMFGPGEDSRRPWPPDEYLAGPLNLLTSQISGPAVWSSADRRIDEPPASSDLPFRSAFSVANRPIENIVDQAVIAPRSIFSRPGARTTTGDSIARGAAAPDNDVDVALRPQFGGG